jgi:hypothetical protein
MPSTGTTLAVLAAVLAAARSADADALRGKRLYLDAARIVGSSVSCVDCHGGLPGGSFGIERAANDPARVAAAIAAIPQMAPLRGRLASADVADLAAYLGDPGVASPQVEVTTQLPGGGPGQPDRVEFGDLALDATAIATLQLRNPGQLGFTLTAAPAITGRDAPEFAIISAGCAPGSVVAPGQACRFELAFRPAGQPGPRTAGFAVDHDWVRGSAAVALLGSAVPPGTPVVPEPAAGCAASTPSSALPLVVLLALRRRRTRPRP